MPKNQKGAAPLILLIAIIGIIGLIVLTTTFRFKNNLFADLFPKPTSQASTNNPRAVSTFHSLSVYWKPAQDPGNNICKIKYRKLGATDWRDGYPLWFDNRTQTDSTGVVVSDKECRGSLVNLTPNTSYEINLTTDKGESTTLNAVTWSEQFPVANTIKVPSQTSRYIISQGGTPTGYVVYEPENSSTVINVRDQAHLDQFHKHALYITAPYVIIRGFKITGANDSDIYLGHGAHHIVVENNDISGWGTNFAADGYGIDFQSGIIGASQDPTVQQIIIQRNKIHNPATGTNSTCEKTARETAHQDGPWHPIGPQGISFIDNGGNDVIRYNEFWSDDNHYFNDIIGGNTNYSFIGSPYRDSDIYGNKLENNMDDAIEADGAGENVRIWGNYFNNVKNIISTSPTSIGPVYIFRNVADQTRVCPDGHQGDSITYPNIIPFQKEHGDFDKIADDATFGRGRKFIFHNTLLQKIESDGANLGASNGLANASIGISNTVSRNNIWNAYLSNPPTYRASCYSVSKLGPYIPDSGNSFDYDLCRFEILPGGVSPFWGAHVLMNQQPIYLPNNGDQNGSNGMYQLASTSPGYNGAQCLANFSDGYKGSAPDIGAQESGSSKMEFGVNAYISGYPIPSSNFCSLFIPGDINQDGVVNVIDYGIFVGDFPTQNLRSDIDHDGRVTVIDYGIFVGNFGH